MYAQQQIDIGHELPDAVLQMYDPKGAYKPFTEEEKKALQIDEDSSLYGSIRFDHVQVYIDNPLLLMPLGDGHDGNGYFHNGEYKRGGRNQMNRDRQRKYRLSPIHPDQKRTPKERRERQQRINDKWHGIKR